MNVTRTFLHEGKTLQEMMEILLPIYIQEKTCNINEEELDNGQVLVYKNGKWENQVIGDIGEGTTAKIEWGHF